MTQTIRFRSEPHVSYCGPDFDAFRCSHCGIREYDPYTGRVNKQHLDGCPKGNEPEDVVPLDETLTEVIEEEWFL